MYRWRKCDLYDRGAGRRIWVGELPGAILVGDVKIDRSVAGVTTGAEVDEDAED